MIYLYGQRTASKPGNVPIKLSTERQCDRPADTGLPYPWWTDETQDRPLETFLELAHGQVFDDTFLQLVEAVMVGIQVLPGNKTTVINKKTALQANLLNEVAENRDEMLGCVLHFNMCRAWKMMEEKVV